MEVYLNIPTIKVKRVFNQDYSCTYYELYLNDKYEGRYQSISSINWRIGLMISEEAMSVEVE